MLVTQHPNSLKTPNGPSLVTPKCILDREALPIGRFARFRKISKEVERVAGKPPKEWKVPDDGEFGGPSRAGVRVAVNFMAREEKNMRAIIQKNARDTIDEDAFRTKLA